MTCSFCGGNEWEEWRGLNILRCHCGVGYTRLSPEPDKRFSSLRYFELLAGGVNPSEVLFTEWGDRIFRLLHEPSPHILDVGFGYGVFLEKMAAKGCIVYGVEISEICCERLKQRLPCAKVCQGSLTDYVVYGSLSHHKFDLISFWDCLQCIPNAVEQIRTADSLLQSGGVLVIQVPNRGRANLSYAQKLSVLHRDLARIFLHMPAAKLFFDPAGLEDWLLRLGPGYKTLARSEAAEKVNIAIRLVNPFALIEDIISIGWQVVAKKRGEASSAILALRKF